MIDRKIEQIIQEVSKNKRNFKKEKKLVSNGYLDSFSVLLLTSSCNKLATGTLS